MLSKKIAVSAICCVLAASMFSACWWDKDSSSSSMVPGSSSIMNDSSSMMGEPSSDMMGGSSSMPGSENSMSSSMNSSSSSMTKSMSAPAKIATAAAAAAAAAPVSGDWKTRLVNAANPLPENFEVATRAIKGYDSREFDTRAADALEQMLNAAEAADNKLYLVSAYRSVSRQKALFARKTNFFIAEGFDEDEAQRQAAMWVARAGTSEHNLGLAVDIVSANWYSTNSDLTEAFDQTPAYAWLAAHSAEYGFVLRYPKGKEKITGVTYEPWHYRYVGSEAARSLTESGLALEEYNAKQ